MRRRRALGALGLALAAGCDPVPDLYVLQDASVDGAVDGGVEAGAESGVLDAAESGEDADDEAGDAAPEGCTGILCPACAPNPGECCPNGIPCLGANCAADCTAGCLSCVAGEMCCSKQGGPAVCRDLDGGKCPP